MKKYDHKKIEKRWQTFWEKKGIYHADDKSKKKKYYTLIEFPYPSGEGLHIGHPRSYTGMDIISRKRRMEGYNVLYPIGWDAFGLPTENYAIKMGLDPRIVTKKNTDNFRMQLKSLGISFDWSREINTTDPKYYKWTQWIFLQFLKKGLAYKAKMSINWCPKDKIGLANEEVINGACERCGTLVEKREKEQWMLAITKYAERLDKDLDGVDYLPQIKLGQRNWIGKSEGAEIDFSIGNEKVKVFTTRPDTIFGATYLVLAPEHELIQKLKSEILNWEEVSKYITANKAKTDLERSALGKEKTGVELRGIKAVNPANKEEISIFIADYVLGGYGTGAIMAVPAHDERDFEFAKKYNLPIKNVIEPFPVGPIVMAFGKDIHSINTTELINQKTQDILEGKEIWINLGKLRNSGKFNGLESEEAKKEIIKFVGGKEKTTFKLRDWVFSRQRYWGEPIPVINCGKCGLVPVPEKDLPVELPKVKNYQPTDSGESPLANISKWVNVKCPKCKSPAKRETDTMPNWAGSSWYYLRYADVKNKKAFADKKNLKYWTPVDWYNGGNEHTTLHLLYSRFWHKFLYDLKLVPTTEPYMKRTSHGMILGEGGVKMSKSLGNVINPNDIVKTYGADTLRVYEMFMGPFDQAAAWSDEAIIGPRRFLERVWNLKEKVILDSGISSKNEMHRVIKKVSEDIEKMNFNTAISALMIYTNVLEKKVNVTKEEYETLLKLLSPFAPHITEELWQMLGHKKTVHLESWPIFDETKIQEEEVNIVVQVNGKVRGQFKAHANINEADATSIAQNLPEVVKWTEGKHKKIIFIPRKIINIVV